MMSDGSTLLITPSEPPSSSMVDLGRTKLPMKRRNEDIGIQSFPNREDSDYPCTKKLRRFVSIESRSSKVRWEPILEKQHVTTQISCDRRIKGEREDLEPSKLAESETWYSKKEYKQMLLDQSLTVHIMRSLRSLAAEKVAIDYCDEIDSDYSRFDELIKKHQIDPEEYCERGLESYLSEERRNEVNASRKLHKLLVIGEYARQSMLGGSDPELVRNVSMNQSKKSLVRAQKLGLVDQREARLVQKSTNEDSQKHLLKKQEIEPFIEKRMDHILSENLPSPVFTSTKGTSTERSFFALDGIPNDVTKQQLLQLVMQQQKDHYQLTQPECPFEHQCHFQQRNFNGNTLPDESVILATLQMQELERLFHQNQQQQQIQIQRNYEAQLQRLLLLQQQQQQRQQHYESIRLVSAAILGYQPR